MNRISDHGEERELLAPIIRHFLTQLPENCARLEQIAERIAVGADKETIDLLLRELHRLEGTAGTLGLTDAAALAKEMEDSLRAESTAMSSGPAAAEEVLRFADRFRRACLEAETRLT